MEEGFDREVNCPYCGKIIKNSAEKCENCGEWFKEPHLDNFKLISIFWYLILSPLTFGFYGIIWSIINKKALLAMANERDAKKLRIIIFLAIPLLIITMFCLTYFLPYSRPVETMQACYVIWFAFYIILSYRMLKIIEKFSYSKYGVSITHHETGMVIFRILYVIYFIETYRERIYHPEERYFFEPKHWVKYSLLLIFLLFIMFMICEIYCPYLLK